MCISGFGFLLLNIRSRAAFIASPIASSSSLPHSDCQTSRCAFCPATEKYSQKARCVHSSRRNLSVSFICLLAAGNAPASSKEALVGSVGANSVAPGGQPLPKKKKKKGITAEHVVVHQLSSKLRKTAFEGKEHPSSDLPDGELAPKRAESSGEARSSAEGGIAML
jgi:hypothetical protein